MADKQQPPAAKQGHTGNLGTFAGVFTPSILTILGIILFLRLGYVVGSAGLARTLVILVLANGISILTTISLSAIATNIQLLAAMPPLPGGLFPREPMLELVSNFVVSWRRLAPKWSSCRQQRLRWQATPPQSKD